MPKLSIFLSHHETETALAQNIRNFLETTSGRAIEVNTYVQKREPGRQFRNWINDAAMSSDMFLFLYTDDTRELSWAAHELGLYEAACASQKRTDHVVCIKSEDIAKMPEVMSHIAPTSANKTNIKKFLVDLLVKGLYSNRIQLASDSYETSHLDKLLDDEATSIARQFGSKIYTEYFPDRLKIRNIVSTPHDKFKDEIKKDRHIIRRLRNPKNGKLEKFVIDFGHSAVDFNENIARIFGVPQRCTWFDLCDITERIGPADRFDIARDILQHASNEVSKTSTAIMLLGEIEIEGQIFKPIISRVESRDRLPIAYYVLLIPDTASRDEEIDKDLILKEAFERDIKLLLLISAARKFRWNVVEPCIWKIRRAIRSRQDLRPVLDEFMKALVKLENESARNKLDDGTFAALLFPEIHRARLKKLWLDYFEIREELVENIQGQNVIKILEILNQFQEMNREFMGTTLDVYKEMMIKLPTLDESEPEWQKCVISHAPEA